MIYLLIYVFGVLLFPSGRDSDEAPFGDAKTEVDAVYSYWEDCLL